MSSDKHFADLLLSAYDSWQKRSSALNKRTRVVQEAAPDNSRRLSVGRVVSVSEGSTQKTTLQLMDETGVRDFVTDRATRLARGNKTFIDDCLRIVDHIRVKPRGRETRRIHDFKVVLDHARYPLLHTDPRKIDGLKSSHKLLGKCRVVFALVGSNGTSNIGLYGAGIMHHGEFDSKFGSRRG